jgi:hypothetical protein
LSIFGNADRRPQPLTHSLGQALESKESSSSIGGEAAEI